MILTVRIGPDLILHKILLTQGTEIADKVLLTPPTPIFFIVAVQKRIWVCNILYQKS